MRIIKTAFAALFTVSAFAALTAASAAAFHPLFLTQSGKELLFTATGGLFLQAGLNVGVLFTISCEKSSIHGWLLNKSTLAHRVEVEFPANASKSQGRMKAPAPNRSGSWRC